MGNHDGQRLPAGCAWTSERIPCSTGAPSRADLQAIPNGSNKEIIGDANEAPSVELTLNVAISSASKSSHGSCSTTSLIVCHSRLVPISQSASAATSRLEAATNLASPTRWDSATAANAITDGPRFFRLRWP